jgi:hypothetical protein
MPSVLRFVAALGWVVLAVAYIARSSFVAAYADKDLARAERVWPDHPAVLSAQAMLEVAQAAARGQAVPSSTRLLAARVARAEPLAAEPFVILGAEAQRNGNRMASERLLLNARQRDPRAPAARFLLAEQYITQGRLREGVSEAAALARLVPGSIEPLAQGFAGYLKAAGVPEGMAELLKSNPGLSQQLLADLSTDPANADLLIELASQEQRTAGPAPAWQANLITKLVEAGDYPKARQVWARLGGRASDPSETIHDPRFEGSSAPPPFNWTFAAQGAVIEPQSGGLHILYFGRDDATLAGQMLVLRPGRYRLKMKVSGQMTDPQAVRWRISCMPGKASLLDVPVPARALDLVFSVPAQGCGAQQLALVGQAADAGGSSDFLISDLSLLDAGAS